MSIAKLKAIMHKGETPSSKHEKKEKKMVKDILTSAEQAKTREEKLSKEVNNLALSSLNTNLNSLVLGKKPISYKIEGEFEMNGPVKIKDKILDLFSLLIITELVWKTVVPPNVYSAFIDDLSSVLKNSSIVKSGVTSSVYKRVLIKKFINLPCYPVGVDHIGKRVCRKYAALSASEDRVIISYNLTLAVADNHPQLYDSLTNSGFIQKKIKNQRVNQDAVTIMEACTKHNSYNLETIVSMITADISIMSGYKKSLAFK